MFKEINDSVMRILGIDTLPSIEQKEKMEELGGAVYQEVILRALEIMSDSDKNTFEKMIEENKDPETIFNYLSEKIPNIKDIAIEEAQKIMSGDGK